MTIAKGDDESAANSMIQLERLSASATSDSDLEYSDHSKLPVEPRVSIAMITYQHGPFIKEALDSVLGQKVDFPYEICIGEDGSTDGTRETCLEYVKKHPDKIRLFLRNRSNPARESFHAPYMLNAAATFDACRGKYIAMLEGDDYWQDVHKLQRQVDQLESDPALAASCHYASCVDENRAAAGKILPEYPIEFFTIENILKRDVGNLHTSTWLLRRGKPMPWEKFRSSSFGDYPVIVWAMLQGTARVFPGTWSAYRIHRGGVFSPLSDEIRLQKNVELWKCLESITPPHLHSAVVIGTIRTLIMFTAVFSKAGNYSKALKCFRRTMTEIARLPSSVPERRQLWWRAVESLILPRLQGARNRWNQRKVWQ